MSQEKRLAEELFGKSQEPKSMGAWDALKEALQTIAPGLNGEKFVKEVGQELHRLGVQGTAELAAALFSESNIFVPYGRGQWPGRSGQEANQAGMDGPHPKEEQGQDAQPPQQERGGREI
jgi:hypothetical protein